MSLIFLGGLVSIVFIVIIAIVMSVGRVKRFEGDLVRSEDMIKTIYIYIVLFVTLMMTIGGSVAAFMAIADIVSPTSYYQSYAEYRPMPEIIPVQNQPTMTQEELKKSNDQMVLQQKQRTREMAVNRLIKSFGWIVIPFPLFLYYQRNLRTYDNT